MAIKTGKRELIDTGTEKRVRRNFFACVEPVGPTEKRRNLNRGAGTVFLSSGSALMRHLLAVNMATHF